MIEDPESQKNAPRIIQAGLPETPVKFGLGYQEPSAKMANTQKPKRPKNTAKISVDGGPKKKRRGRPGANPSEIVMRAENYRRMFWTQRLRGSKEDGRWVRDKPYEWAVALLAAKTAVDASQALDSAPSYAQNELRLLSCENVIFQRGRRTNSIFSLTPSPLENKLAQGVLATYVLANEQRNGRNHRAK